MRMQVSQIGRSRPWPPPTLPQADQQQQRTSTSLIEVCVRHGNGVCQSGVSTRTIDAFAAEKCRVHWEAGRMEHVTVRSRFNGRGKARVPEALAH